MDMENKEFEAIEVSFIKTSDLRFKGQDADSFCLPVIGDYNYIRIKGCGSAENNINSVMKKYYENKTNDNTSNNEIASKHTYYGIREQDSSKREQDSSKMFFPNYNSKFDKAFLFVTLITFDFVKAIDTYTKEHIRENLINNIVNNKNLNKDEFLIYTSLDSFDIMLFIKSDKYDEVSKKIQNIDESEYVLYSYSLLAYNLECLNKAKNNENANKITICGVIRDKTEFITWFKDFESEYKKADKLINRKVDVFRIRDHYYYYNRLGNEDIIINIRESSVKKFLSYLENGLLFNKDQFSKAFISCRIHIDNDYEKTQDCFSQAKLKIKLLKKFNQSIEKNMSYRDKLDKSVKVAITEILRSCDNLFNNGFALDILACINEVYKFFLERVKSFSNPEKNTFRVYDESINEFKNSINSIVAGLLHADRMFFHSPGFNAVQYSYPSKLLLFYFSFAEDIKSFLKDVNDDQVDVIITPDLCFQTTCEKLFLETDQYDSLLKMHLSVDKLFKPELFLPVLTHEIAHYLGDIPRCRQERFMCYRNAFAYWYVSILLNGLPKNNDFDTVSKFFMKRITEKFDDYFEYPKTTEEEIKEEDARKLPRKEILLHNIESQSRNLFIELNTVEKLHDMVEEFCKNLPDSTSEIEGLKDLSTFISFYRKKNLCDVIEKNIINANNQMEDIFNLFKTTFRESYADLVKVSLLHISPDEYIKLITSDVEDKNKEGHKKFLEHGCIFERIYCLFGAKGWKISKLKNDYPKDFKTAYEETEKSKEEYKPLVRTLNLFIQSYFKICSTKLDEIENDSLKNESLKRIRQKYECLSKNVLQLSSEQFFDSIIQYKYEQISDIKNANSTEGSEDKSLK